MGLLILHLLNLRVLFNNARNLVIFQRAMITAEKAKRNFLSYF